MTVCSFVLSLVGRQVGKAAVLKKMYVFLTLQGTAEALKRPCQKSQKVDSNTKSASLSSLWVVVLDDANSGNFENSGG